MTLPVTLPVTLPAALVASWTAAPDRPVLWTTGTGWLTGAQLEERSRQVARRLAVAGVRAGDRVLLSGAPCADLVVSYLALLRLGSPVVPANTAYTERELAHIVAEVRPVAALLGEARALPGVPVVSPIDASGLPPGTAADGADAVLDRAGPEDPALIGFTSGTTGAPKGAVLSQRNLHAGAAAVVEAWRWTPDDRLACALPLFHMHGLGVALGGTLLSGASIVVLPRFTVDGVLDAISEHRASLFFGVPTMYSRLAGSARLGELAALRLAVSGSAPLPATLWSALQDGSGQRVLERYGMTETVMLTSNPYDGERRPGTVGLPLPGVSLRLAPDSGVVEVRGPSVFSAYWQRPADTKGAFTGDGWFRTGDIGAVSEDGYLTLVGRASELIISGGFNIYPREVEDVLRGHPAIGDVAVIGLPDPEWGEIVTAYCVGDPVSEEELMAYCGPLLASFKRPRRWRWVEALPRNAMGKVVRDQVRELG
ncbi:MAG: AMP-binding protein [Actinobacteria bacterium]|nr:AMP-binding protein [Actinomycetota bacterium]MBI3687327.1 AMP-binding protein [Actinomycetota bacterium]